MNIMSCYSLHDIVSSLELALQIEGSDLRETDMNRMLDNVKLKINRQYAIDIINFKVDDPEIEGSPMRSETELFIENIAVFHEKLCGYCHIRRYLTSSEVSLEDVNYLGITKESMEKNLIALQRLCYKPRVEQFIEVVKQKLPTISNSLEKRLFILLIVCWEIGFSEISAAIAEILYQSKVK
ncbi:MAG: hypothetical protein IJE43_18995 [Alphaproteobacteria bacterium]|nr:hypothetical protein [Alphaproteobacteria bacterium]